MHDLHENTLWFSNIREIEKEISFRTESGLYYSYYKSLVSSNSFWGTLFDFTRDTSTEFPRSINVLQRFNIYPEVLIAALHKIVSVYYAVPAIMFYVYCSFFLSGLSLFGVYLLAWIYGGSWFQGFIAGVWMIVNYEDSSRVNFAVNLREVYALPFLWLQYVIIVRSIQGASFSRIPFVVTTFLFAVSWQFNQFILMLQSLSMFTFTLICPSFQLLLREVVSAQTLGFFLVVLVQFLQPMALFSPLIFMNITIYYFSFRVPSKFNVVKTVFIMLVLLALVFAYNLAIKVVIGNSSDTHIRTFVIAKLGIPLDNSSFETNLYLCHSAFAYLGYDFIERTMKNGLLQAFSVSFVLTLGSLIKEWWLDQPLSPLQTLLSIKSIVFGLLAFTTMRMKYVFLPHALIIASAAFSFFDRFFGRFHKFFKFAVIMSLAFSISRTHFNFYLKVMSHEQEFYDPDTVKLMEWIQTLPSESVFSGSMQLMAGVKCCTGRNITNHPHFEDKLLRDRTFRIYQIYGKTSVEEVHRILKAENTTHIILEDSICLAKSNGCALKDLVDSANGHRTESGRLPFPALHELPRSPSPRFCELLRKKGHSLFIPVFRNRTFRVYRLV